MSRVYLVLTAILVFAVSAASAYASPQLGLDAIVVPGQSYKQFHSTHQPPQTGDLIWFDILIRDGLGQNAEGVQIALWVAPSGHPGSLVLDAAASEAIAGETDYWIHLNSTGAYAHSIRSNKYAFGDGPNNPPFAPLTNGRAVARFAFTWDGVPGFYQVDVDPSTQNTYLLQNSSQNAPSWEANPVMLYIPEPASVFALAVACFVLIRRS